MSEQGERDALDRVAAHLATVADLREHYDSLGAVRQSRSGPTVAAQMAEEVAAAAELLRGEMERFRARLELHHQATERLELVTAGDERLIDDLGAAIEQLRLDVDRLAHRQDLLAERRG